MYIKQEDIFAKTNGGLDIILSYFPQAEVCLQKKNAKFKVRGTEKTASANIKEVAGGVWVLTDFGDDSKPRNAIAMVMQEENTDFKGAINIIAQKFGIEAQNGQFVENKANFSKRKAKRNEKDGNFYFDYKKEISENELSVLGKYVTAEVCERYNLRSLKSYTIIKEREALVFESTDTYPIFCYDNVDFQKIYQPLNSDKKYRFMFYPNRPKDFVFGLEQCEKQLEDYRKTLNEEDEPEKKKLDEIILCSGERDALNVASSGYPVICLNSESAKLETKLYKRIMKSCETLYNLPDIDETGLKQSFKLGLQYLDIKTIYLPMNLRTKKDFRGNECKDVRDYFKYNTKKQFNNLLKVALPLKFWDTSYKYNKKSNSYDPKFTFNNLQAYNFLEKNGFFRYENKNVKEGYMYVHLNGNSVRKIEDKTDVKAFIHGFLEERKESIELRNTFFRTPHLSDNSLSNLRKKDIDFEDYGKDFQLMFFNNKTWKITPNGIEEYKFGELKKYVWSDEIIEHNVKLKQQDPFTITKDDSGNFDLKINDDSCLFFKYLQRTSQVHWRQEKPTEAHKYEETLHLINKIYAIGYLLHTYKDPSRPWCVFAMDNKISDSGESHGGSGKSICFKAIRQFKQSVNFDGRNPKLTDNNHLYDRVTEHTDYILIDDANQYLNFDFFFAPLTGELVVNPKATKSYEIPFAKAPKFAITSNFTLRNIDSSTERRLLYTVFSDYFHHNSTGDYNSSHTVRDEFGKNLFDEFTKDEWNLFFNTMAHCVKFYMNHGKIDPPMGNVQKRNLKTQMGDLFHGWADSYFNESNTNLQIPKNEVYEDFLKENKVKNWTSSRFKKSLKAWCNYNDYTLHDRINKTVDKKTVEHIEIEANNLKHLE